MREEGFLCLWVLGLVGSLGVFCFVFVGFLCLWVLGLCWQAREFRVLV